MTFFDSSSLKCWEIVSEIGFLIVIIGVAGESAELIEKWYWSKRPKAKRFRKWLRLKRRQHDGSKVIRPHNQLRRSIVPLVRFVKKWILPIETVVLAVVVFGLAMEFFGSHEAMRIADSENSRLNDRASSNELARVVLEKEVEVLRKANNELISASQYRSITMSNVTVFTNLLSKSVF